MGHGEMEHSETAGGKMGPSGSERGGGATGLWVSIERHGSVN